MAMDIHSPEQHPAGEFACQSCPGPKRSDETIVEDPLYVGPEGHSNAQCFECYCDAYDMRRAAFARWDYRGGKMFRAMMYWAVGGHTHRDAAQMAGISAQALRRRIKKIRENRF